MNELPDPGWGRKRDMILGALVPFFVIRRRGPNPLVVLRTVFGAFLAALPLVGIVSIVVTTGTDPIEKAFDPVIVVLVVGAIGALLVTVPERFEPDLACETATGLAQAYRLRLFRRIAFAESAALIGFVALVLSGRALPYFVGAAWTLSAFARLAPTAANLQKDQKALDQRGCSLRLTDCLQTPGL